MDHRQRVLVAVILSLVVTFSVGSFTEYVHQSMTFSWAIEEGDIFTFDVSVRGSISTSTIVLPPEFLIMNNTRVSVEIVILPNVSITFYGSDFIENVVDYLKTSTTFENGTSIPIQHYNEINTHLSRCMIPIGAWTHLDSFFPNDLQRPFMEHESYLSARFRDYFYFGYSLNDTNRRTQWYGIFDLDTGVPQTVVFSEYRVNQPWIHWYNITMQLVD